MPSYIGKKTLNVLVESLKPNGEVCGFTDSYLQVFTKEVMNFWVNL